MNATKIRNDGKRARTPRLGTPPSSLEPVSKLAEDEKPPFWTDLIQQPDTHNRANKAETLRRRDAHGQIRPDTAEVVEPSSIRHGNQRHGIPVRSWVKHGLVLHNTRLHARGSGGIDREAARLRLRAERKIAAANAKNLAA